MAGNDWMEKSGAWLAVFLTSHILEGLHVSTLSSRTFLPGYCAVIGQFDHLQADVSASREAARWSLNRYYLPWSTAVNNVLLCPVRTDREYVTIRAYGTEIVDDKPTTFGPVASALKRLVRPEGLVYMWIYSTWDPLAPVDNKP